MLLPSVSSTFQLLAASALLLSQSAAAAQEDRLIDKSIEPPTVHTPDFAEAEPVAPSPMPHTPRGPVVPSARQPAGALSGKIVFTNGGHGWTWDPNYWRVQRGITQEMNEDLGNLDQMNLFAACCFNAGAVVVPMRPVGHQTNEVVLDNDDAEVTWTGTWANSTSTYFFGSAGDVPYRYAALAAVESATATYTPNIPATGFYPVYTWVRSGDDRGNQLYRVRHTGGETQVRIPHHMVGNGWVYLGEYYFNAGANSATGSVIVSNQRSSAEGTYTFADAIRFGNGMGTVNRGTGISTYPCEEENCRYWIQANLGQGQSATLYNGGGDDESDSWSAPPKMSAEMNRESAGSIYDRIHISFHSNAGGGRGTLALRTGTPTTNQAALSQLCGAEVNNDLVALGSPPLEVPWNNRTTVTHTGGYSEIDGSLFQYEMDATIIEVAFHDSVDDSKLMRDPRARLSVGKAAMHAVIKYMNQFDGLPLNFPPDPPNGLRVRGAANGSAVLNWTAPVSTGGAGAPTGYVIYRSTNGYGFGWPVEVGNVATATVTGLAPGVEYFFRVAARNAGGESFPTEVGGCRLPADNASPRVLVVNAFDRYDRNTNLRQDLARQGYAPPDATGAAERVLPARTNSFDYVVPHGRAISAYGMAFDSCQNEAVSGGQVTLADYKVLVWACGQERTGDETFSAAEQIKVTEFRTAGGHLMVSGSEIAWDLDRASGPTAADRAFLNSQLKAHLASDADSNSGIYTVTPSATGIFAGLTDGVFDDGSRGIYWVQAPDVLTASGTGVKAALNYTGAGIAALQYDGSAAGGRVVYLGFPFETLTSNSVRTQMMSRILDYFTSPAILVAAGSVWKYNDTGSDLGTAWTATDYNDSAWPAGPAQLGFGESDEATSVINNPARTTTYFRRSFTVAGTGQYGSLRLRLLRDDAAVVWLNGAEVHRSNLPDTGPISWSTQALASVGGVDENVFLTYPLDPRRLRSGTNVLAVEIHQAGLTSSDLSFDLELAGLPDTTPVTLIPGGSVWKFRDNSVTPSAPWTTAAYNDTAWSSGAARLGYGGDGEATLVSNGGDPANVFTTTWFRRTFNVTDASAFDGLRVDLQRDDAAVVYLNGTELLRDNLPSTTITSATFATAGIGGTDEQVWRSFVVPASPLVSGSNALAVEIHQASLTSSDIGFDLVLFGLTQPPTTYAGWQAINFGSDSANATLTAELADPDNDGCLNLLEYALGSRPTAATPFPSLLSAPLADRLAIRFTRNALASDLSFTVQVADTLTGPWTDLAQSTTGDPFTALLPGVSIIEPATGALRTVEVRDAFPFSDIAHPRRFMRLKVTKS